MRFTFRKSSNWYALGINKQDIPFFHAIDKTSKYSIKLNIIDINTGLRFDDVLRNKKVDEKCPEITKVSGLKNHYKNGQIFIVDVMKIIEKNGSIHIFPRSALIPGVDIINDNIVINGTQIPLENIKEITLEISPDLRNSCYSPNTSSTITNWNTLPILSTVSNTQLKILCNCIDLK